MWHQVRSLLQNDRLCSDDISQGSLGRVISVFSERSEKWRLSSSLHTAGKEVAYSILKLCGLKCMNQHNRSFNRTLTLCKAESNTTNVTFTVRLVEVWLGFLALFSHLKPCWGLNCRTLTEPFGEKTLPSQLLRATQMFQGYDTRKCEGTAWTEFVCDKNRKKQQHHCCFDEGYQNVTSFLPYKKSRGQQLFFFHCCWTSPIGGLALFSVSGTNGIYTMR